MAFNQKEQEIINWGLQNGKSKDEVVKALRNFRVGITPQATQPAPEESEEKGLIDRIGGRISGAGAKVADIVSGEGEFAGQSPVVGGFKAAATALNTIPQVGYEVLPKFAREGLSKVGEVVGKGFSAVTDKLSETKLFKELGELEAQGFLTRETAPEYFKVKDTLDIASSAGQIAGDVLLADQTAKIAQAGVSKASELSSKAIQEARTVYQKARSGATDLAGKAVEKAKGLAIKDAPKSVETVLKETPTDQFDKALEVAKKSIESNKNPSGFEVVGNRAGEALDQIQRKLSEIGKNKSTVLNSVAGRKPVGDIVLKYRQGLENFAKSKTLVGGDAKLVNDVLKEATKLGNNPNALAVDKFIDFVQDRIYTGSRNLTIPTTDAVTGSLQKLTGQLNSNLKAQLPVSYKNVNQRYSDLVKTRNELNLKLGAEGERAGALVKRIFSPSDANTKKLFSRVKEITGIDLVNEATLAKYLGEVLGDARQASLLEQLKLNITTPTAGGVINRAIDYGIKKLNTPEAQIMRARGATVGGSPQSSLGQSALRSSQTKPQTQLSQSVTLPKSTTKSTPKQAGKLTGTSYDELKAAAEGKTSIEGIIEKSGGWKPGQKTAFDIALYNKDAATVRAMLPDIPAKYKLDFAKKIEAVLKTKPNTQGGYIKNPFASFFKQEPLAGVLKEMEDFIDYVRIKKIPKGYTIDEFARGKFKYEANVRDLVAKYGIRSDVGNKKLADTFEEILQVAEKAPELPPRDNVGRFVKK